MGRNPWFRAKLEPRERRLRAALSLLRGGFGRNGPLDTTANYVYVQPVISGALQIAGAHREYRHIRLMRVS